MSASSSFDDLVVSATSTLTRPQDEEAAAVSRSDCCGPHGCGRVGEASASAARTDVTPTRSRGAAGPGSADIARPMVFPLRRVCTSCGAAWSTSRLRRTDSREPALSPQGGPRLERGVSGQGSACATVTGASNPSSYGQDRTDVGAVAPSRVREASKRAGYPREALLPGLDVDDVWVAYSSPPHRAGVRATNVAGAAHERSHMPRLVLTHGVVEIERWLKGKEERAAAIGTAGSDVRDHVAVDGSNQVAVTAEVDDLDALQAMLASPPPEIAAQMERHGVVPPIVAYIERS